MFLVWVVVVCRLVGLFRLLWMIWVFSWWMWVVELLLCVRLRILCLVVMSFLMLVELI